MRFPFFITIIIKIIHYAKMDRNSTKGGDSFTGYIFILGVVFRIVCFGTGVIGFSVGLVETGTTRSNGILNSPQKNYRMPGFLPHNYL